LLRAGSRKVGGEDEPSLGDLFLQLKVGLGVALVHTVGDHGDSSTSRVEGRSVRGRIDAESKTGDRGDVPLREHFSDVARPTQSFVGGLAATMWRVFTPGRSNSATRAPFASDMVNRMATCEGAACGFRHEVDLGLDLDDRTNVRH